MYKKAMILVSIAALALLLGACATGPATPGGPGGPGGTFNPETEGTWNLDFAGTDYSSSSADDSYAAGWWNSSTGDLVVWVWTDYDYDGNSSDTGIWAWYVYDASTGEETVYAYDYTGASLTFYASESSAAVTADLNPQTGTYYQGVGIGRVTGSFSATVVDSNTSTPTTVSVTNLDAVLYDYANYANP